MKSEIVHKAILATESGPLYTKGRLKKKELSGNSLIMIILSVVIRTADVNYQLVI